MRARFGLLVLVLMTSQLTLAQAVGGFDRIAVHGFAAQSIIKTSANRWFGNSPQTSFDFSEIGVNASWPAHRRLLLSGQVLSRRAGEMDDGKPELDYALLDWDWHASVDGQVGLRLGRIKIPLGLYNETRDVPFTRTSIFLPQVIYFDRIRDSFLSADGVLFHGDVYSPLGNLALQVGAGRIRLDENVEWSYLTRDFPGEFEASGFTPVVALWYASPAERLRIGLSGTKATAKFAPDRDATLTLQRGATDIVYGIVSVQLNFVNWSLAAEYARETISWRDYGVFWPDRKAVAEGYFVEGIYRVMQNVQFVTRYEEGFGDRDDRSGQETEATSKGMLLAQRSFSKILTAGLRFDIGRHWMIRADYQYHHGTFILSPREKPEDVDWVEYWHLFAGQVAVRF